MSETEIGRVGLRIYAKPNGGFHYHVERAPADMRDEQLIVYLLDVAKQLIAARANGEDIERIIRRGPPVLIGEYRRASALPE